MARRLSINEEAEIVDYMRWHAGASVRSVARLFGRSRPTVSSIRDRYALDRPQAPLEVQNRMPVPPEDDPLAGTNLFEMTDEQFEILVRRLEETQP